MKKHTLLAIVMVIVVVVAGYFIFGRSNNAVDYKEYNAAKQYMLTNAAQGQFNNCEVDALLKLEDSKYKVSVILGDADNVLEDIDILIADAHNINSNNTYPSLGLLDNKHLNLGPTKEGVTNKTYILNYISDTSVGEVCIYFAYTLNGTRKVEVVKVPVRV